nr:hypothetical protein Iba_chr09cCG1200 [Ipomoea batatas]
MTQVTPEESAGASSSDPEEEAADRNPFFGFEGAGAEAGAGGDVQWELPVASATSLCAEGIAGSLKLRDREEHWEHVEINQLGLLFVVKGVEGACFQIGKSTPDERRELASLFKYSSDIRRTRWCRGWCWRLRKNGSALEEEDEQENREISLIPVVGIPDVITRESQISLIPVVGIPDVITRVESRLVLPQQLHGRMLIDDSVVLSVMIVERHQIAFSRVSIKKIWAQPAENSSTLIWG